jgi:hypothetical protein
MYTVTRLDADDQAASPALTAVVPLKILSEQEPVVQVTFILRHPTGRSYPVVTSDVGLDERERTAVLRWLGGRLPDLDTSSALFEVSERGRT